MLPTIVWSFVVHVASTGSPEISRFQSSAAGNIVHPPIWPGMPFGTPPLAPFDVPADDTPIPGLPPEEPPSRPETVSASLFEQPALPSAKKQSMGHAARSQ